MTLYRQLVILVTVVFMLLFMSTLYISVDNTRQYLNDQLSSHAQDAATSLGISLTAEIASGDIAAIETYINAMFDSGYYESIKVVDVEEQVLFEKVRKQDVVSVPSWFIEQFPLDTPTEQAMVMSGWQNYGVVYISSYPEFAYKELWRNAKHIFALYLGFMLALLGLSLILLHFLLKPLKDIVRQANAICNRDFAQIEKEPRTLDFKVVVTAMNKMTDKVKSMFAEQAKTIDDLKHKLFKDPVTGLANRTFLMKKLRYWCESEECSLASGVLLLQVDDLIQLNKTLGHQTVDSLLREVATLLQSQQQSHPEAIAAHTTGSEFFLFMPNINRDELQVVIKQVVQGVKQIGETHGVPDLAHFGVVVPQGKQPLSELMSDVDMALRLAQGKGANSYHLVEQSGGHVVTHGAHQWRDIIEQALRDNHFAFALQKVTDSEGNVVQYEVMLRLKHEDVILSAGQFLPMAEHLDLARDIDQWMIEHVISRIESEEGTHYCVNLSSQSVKDISFVAWLKDKLNSLGVERSARLILELSEYQATKNMVSYRYLLDNLKPLGCHFSLDHFGFNLDSLDYLEPLRLDFLRIDGSYVRALSEDDELASFIAHLCQVARNLDIKVIAEGIETETELSKLKSMSVDYYQGYLIGKPELNL